MMVNVTIVESKECESHPSTLKFAVEVSLRHADLHFDCWVHFPLKPGEQPWIGGETVRVSSGMKDEIISKTRAAVIAALEDRTPSP